MDSSFAKQVPRQPPAYRMALFFDADWFEAKLAERGLEPAALAAGAGMSDADLPWRSRTSASSRPPKSGRSPSCSA